MDVMQNCSMDCLAPQRLDSEHAVWTKQQLLEELGASDDGDLYWEQHQEQQRLQGLGPTWLLLDCWLLQLVQLPLQPEL